jgi:hypothetical protein
MSVRLESQYDSVNGIRSQRFECSRRGRSRVSHTLDTLSLGLRQEVEKHAIRDGPDIEWRPWLFGATSGDQDEEL